MSLILEQDLSIDHALPNEADTYFAGAVSVKAKVRAAPDDTGDQTQLVFRRNMSSRWIWLLLTTDLHVVNRSDSDFDTRQACAMDAEANGF